MEFSRDIIYFAKLRGMEEDLRSIVIDLIEQHNAPHLLMPKLHETKIKSNILKEGADINSNDYKYLIKFLYFKDVIDMIYHNLSLFEPAHASFFRDTKYIFDSEKKDNIVHYRNQVAHGKVLDSSIENYIDKCIETIVSKSSLISLKWENSVNSNSITKEIYNNLKIELKKFHLTLPKPDYKRTEFIGRKKELAEITRSIDKNSVTIISGIGGMGKTALARKVVENIWMDSPEAFNKINWISFKKQQLTFEGTIKIESDDSNNFIATDLQEGLSKVLKQNNITPKSSLNQILNQVAAFFTQYDSLLVLDNLEDLNDSDLNEIENVKVDRILITSRVATSHGQYAINLNGLEESDAKQYVRKLNESYGEKAIKGLQNSTIQELVHGLSYNPLIIKVAIETIIELDYSIEMILQNTSGWVLFCLTNVFEKYNISTKLALKYICYFYKNSITRNELDFLLDMEQREFDIVVLNLKNSSFIICSSTNMSEPIYEMKTIAKDYITKNHTMFPYNDEYRKFSNQIKSLQQVLENETERSSVNNFNKMKPANIEATSINEKLSKFYLKKAYSAINVYNKSKNSDDISLAEKLISKAATFNGNNIEYYLMNAQYYLSLNILDLALQDNYRAYLLDSENIRAVYYYIKALIRNRNYDTALEIANKLELELKDHVRANIFKSVIYLRKSDYEKALEFTLSISQNNINKSNEYDYFDLLLQYFD